MCKKHENASTVSSPLLPTQSALHPDSKVSVLSPVTCTLLSIIVQKFRTFPPFFALPSSPSLRLQGPYFVTPALGPWISGSLSCRSGPWNCGSSSCRSGPWTLEVWVLVLSLRPLDLGTVGPRPVAPALGPWNCGSLACHSGLWTLKLRVLVLSLLPLDLGTPSPCPVTPALGTWNSTSLSCRSGPWTLELRVLVPSLRPLDFGTPGP